MPGAGWIGLDGTSGLLTGEGHIPLACTASPAHAAPLDGTSNVPASSVEFSTTIARLGHETRPTAPFTDDVWNDLLAGGARADAALTAAGLKVTVGGEPTFTSRDNAAAEEWQGGALGRDKWQRGRLLADELLDRLAPGGLVLYRQGKQYPGESLPRWALDVISRRDGVALWPERALASDAAAIEDAHRFSTELARVLGLDTDLQPAFEDPWEVVRGEAHLPPDIDPRKAGLDDPEERRRLAKIFTQGVGSVVGYVLPLARLDDAWVTEHWNFRRGELFLLPGDSPIGLRLPLGSLPASPPPPPWEEPDVVDPRRDPDDAQLAEHKRVPKKRAPRPGEPGVGIRTALAIEPRDGELWLFLPPVTSFDHFCALIAAIDQTRAKTGIAVHVEGYGPPPSPNLRKFSVTPDPGVLEVNLPPTYSSREAADVHATVFEAALASGLTAERYMLDGRMAGSGGGNHITIGGPTPLASTWLVRPDTLASLITFVQHHPSLSYMFSGLFVGPTSQAPRVDEARHDALYELEIALPRLHASPATSVPTWEIDAVLRHLLVDVAGSTHRAEISIDKLFDPLTPHGRQGLVELRAFEMPPHPRMAAAQVVLMRALVATFVKAPYKHALVRWGAELHDRFLLPYFMWRDFEDVLAHLASHDVALPPEAFRPFVELRCPLVGSLELDGARVEVRNAIEPWHVLGEEATQSGTARYVDSSMERLEIRAHGLDEERFVVTINGITLPMRRAGGRDVRVGGVRFRAWCPPHALHPHLGIHHPVRVEVVDTWAKRGVVGGAYHVWHPEGRAFDSPPLTRVEAAARRAQRFRLEGPTPWPVRARSAEPHPEQPYTLDLRRLDAGTPMPRAEEWITE
ncbi:MAG TPA: transglutaminase family protein [Kofleriaceae bacterium]